MTGLSSFSKNEKVRASEILGAHLLGLVVFVTLSIFIPTTSSASANFSVVEGRGWKVLSQNQCDAEFAEVNNENFRRVNAIEGHAREQERGGLAKLFDWEPTGGRKRLVTPDCDSAHLEHALIRAGRSGSAQGQAIGAYFKRCDSHLRRNAPSSYTTLAQLAHIQYRLCSNPSIRKVAITLPDGSKVRGYLALKPGSTRRPLVISKCGILCDSGDISGRAMLMHLFDESPFHVLAIGNVSGAEYVRDNGYIAVGGYSEGPQILQLAQMIRKSGFAKRVSTVHVAAYSLGGHAALYASLLNDHNKVDGRRLISSFTAVSPVVELKYSVDELFGSRVKGRLARFLFLDTMNRVISKVPFLRILFPTLDPKSKQIPGIVADNAVNYYLKNPRQMPSPLSQYAIRSHEDFWKYNHFTSFGNRTFGTPTHILASNDDPIVLTSHNAALLSKVRSRESSNNLTVNITGKGSHCGFNMTFGWQTATSLLRGIVLANDPDYARSGRKIRIPLVSSRSQNLVTLRSLEKVDVTRFEYQKGVASIKMKIMVSEYRLSSCAVPNQYEAPAKCFRPVEFNVPFANFGKSPPHWARIPRTHAEAQALTRWANSNLRMVDLDGNSVEGKPVSPAAITWTDYSGS